MAPGQLHSGWLSVGGERFYFVLYDDCLARFRTEEDARSGSNAEKMDFDNVEDVDVIGTDESVSVKFTFSDKTAWECKADSKQAMEEWLDALEPVFGEDGEAPQEPTQISAVDARQSTGTDSAVPTLDLSMPVGSAGHTTLPDSAAQGAAPAPTAAPGSTAVPAPTAEPSMATAPSYPRLPAASIVSTNSVGDVAQSAAPVAPAKASATSPEASAATKPAGATPAAPKAASATPKAAAPNFSPAPRTSGDKLASPAHVGEQDEAAASLVMPIVAPVRPAAPVAAAAPAVKKTPSVKLTVVGATGPLFAKAAPDGRWVTCEVPSKLGQVFRTTTRSQAKPQWNHDMVIRNYQWNDMLHLSVVCNHEIVGSCDLQTSTFHPKAFDGTVDLLDDTQAKLKNCKLKLRISGKDLDSLKAPVKQVQEAAARESEDTPLPTVIEETMQALPKTGGGKDKPLKSNIEDEDENSPPGIDKTFSEATRGPRGGVRLKGTVYAAGSDDGQLSSRSSMKSRTPVSSVIDESSDREDAPAEDDDQANQTFNAARYRGKYHNLSTRLQFQGQDEKTALLNSMSPKLMWVVEGKPVKKWESQSVIHKQITLQGLMAQSPNVRVNIVRMRGRRAGGWKLRWDGECRCHVRNPVGQVSTKFSTGMREDLASTLSATAWNYECEVVLDSNRDSLEFTIHGICKDASPKTEVVLGKARLSSARFLAAGFNGDLRIESQETVEAYLHVVVAVLRIWDENLNMEIPPLQAATLLKRASPADASILSPGKGWPAKLPVKASKTVKVTTHDMLHFDAMRRNLDRELQGKMVHQTMTTPFRKRRWMWDEVDNVLMREVYGAPRGKTDCQPLASASETIATAVAHPPGPRLEFSTAHVFEEGDAELACTGPALDRNKHYLCLNEDYSEGSSEDFDNNAVESSSESDELDSIGKENNRGDSTGMGQANNVGSVSKSQLGGQSVGSSLPLDSKRKLSAAVEAGAAEGEKEVPLLLLVSDDSNQARVYLKQQGVAGSGDPLYADLTEVAGACGIRPDDLTVVGRTQLSRESADKMMGAVNKMKEQRPSLKFLTVSTKSVPTAACKKGSAWAIAENVPQAEESKGPKNKEESKELKSKEPVNQTGRSGGDSDDVNKSRSFFGFGKAKQEQSGKEQSKKKAFLPFRGKSADKASEKKSITAGQSKEELSPKQGKGMMSKIGGFMRKSKKNTADAVQEEQEENEEEEEEEQEEEEEEEDDDEESADEEDNEKREEPVSAPVAEADDEGDTSQPQMVQSQHVKKKTVINLFEDVVEISGGRSSDEEASDRERAALVIQKKQRQLFAKAEFERRRQEALASHRDKMKKDKKDKMGKHDSEEGDRMVSTKSHKERGHRHGKHKNEHKHHKPKDDVEKKKGKDDESPRRDSLHRLEPAPHHYAEPPGGLLEERPENGWELARLRVTAMMKESPDPVERRQSFRSAQPRIDTGLRRASRQMH